MTDSYNASFIFSGALTVLASIISAVIPLIENKSKRNNDDQLLKNEEKYYNEVFNVADNCDWTAQEIVDRRLADIIDRLASEEDLEDDEIIDGNLDGQVEISKRQSEGDGTHDKDVV